MIQGTELCYPSGIRSLFCLRPLRCDHRPLWAIELPGASDLERVAYAATLRAIGRPSDVDSRRCGQTVKVGRAGCFGFA